MTDRPTERARRKRIAVMYGCAVLFGAIVPVVRQLLDLSVGTTYLLAMAVGVLLLLVGLPWALLARPTEGETR